MNMNANRFKFFLMNTLLVISFSCFSSGHQYNFSNLLSESGIVSPIVYDIEKDKSGFLWFSTSSGVSRYDGKNFLNYEYSPGTKNSLSNNFANAVESDQHGNIWVATEGGINVIDIYGNVKFIKASKESGLDTNWITEIYIDSHSKIWVLTGKGIYLKDDLEHRFKKISGIDKSVYKMTEDKVGNLYVIGMNNLYSINNKSLKAKEINYNKNKINSALMTIAILNDGNIGIGTEKSGFTILKDNQIKIYNNNDGLSENAIYEIYQDKKNNIWLGHYSTGISIIEGNTGKIDNISHVNYDSNSLSGNSVSRITEIDGTIWVATDKGISKYNTSKNAKIIDFSIDNYGLSDNTVNDSVSINQNEFYVAHDTGLDFVKKDGSVEKNIFRKLLPEISKMPIHSADKIKDLIWMTTSSGIVLHNHKTKITKLYSNKKGNPYGLREGEYRTIKSDGGTGAYITGLYSIGLIHFDYKTEKATSYMASPDNRYNINGNFTSELIISKDKDIWLATTDSVYKFNKKNKQLNHYNLV